MLVKRHSDFPEIGLLGLGGVMGDMRMLLLNPSGVETIEASRISLNFCWSSHCPELLYNVLVF